MNIALLLLFACYVAPTFAGWFNCEPCRCHQSSYKVIAQCLRTNSPSDRTLDFVPKGFIKDIQKLQIRGHQIKTLHENNFEHYHNLEILDLSKNRISEVKNRAFENLMKLRELTLSCNDLITLPTTIFRDTPHLISIYLNNNKFTTLQKDLFSNLPYLEDVHIQNNSLLNVQENCFVNVPLLATINLSRNQLTHISSKTFPNLSKMKTVNLAYNPWNCDAHLCEIMSLTVLHSWDKLSSPVCHSPENKYGKIWRDVLNNNTPTITHFVSKNQVGQNVTLQCDVCSKSGIIWIDNHQKVFNNDAMTDKYSSTSLLILSKVSDDNNGVYSCRVKDCVKCDEDTVSLHVGENSLEILRPIKTLKLGGKIRKSIEGMVTSTKANENTSTATSTTFKITEIPTTPVTEQILPATASKYIDIKDEIERKSGEIGSKTLLEFLGFYIIIPSLSVITLLIVAVVVLRYRRKYKSLKKIYAQKQNEQPYKEPESEPLRNENSNSNHTRPPSTHKCIQVEIISNEGPIITSTQHSDEANQTNSNRTLRDNRQERRSYMQDRSNSTYSEDNTSTWTSSSSGRSTTSSEIFSHMMRTRNDSGYGSNDKPEHFVLIAGTSFYNDEID